MARAVERSGDKLSVPKTAAGRRFIDLSPEVYQMVRHYADRHAQPKRHDLYFPTSTGRWQTPENWRNWGFAAACFEAGLVITEEVKGEIVEKPKYVAVRPAPLLRVRPHREPERSEDDPESDGP